MWIERSYFELHTSENGAGDASSFVDFCHFHRNHLSIYWCGDKVIREIRQRGVAPAAVRVEDRARAGGLAGPRHFLWISPPLSRLKKAILMARKEKMSEHLTRVGTIKTLKKTISGRYYQNLPLAP